METIKNFIKKNFTIIVMILALLTFFKSCGDSRALAKINKNVYNNMYAFFVLEGSKTI